MFIDTHIHTNKFSNDAVMPVMDLISYAKTNPSTVLCTTEHYDYDYPDKENQLIFDLEEYFLKFTCDKNSIENITQISTPYLLGIEYGYMEHLGAYYNNLSGKYPFDSIICSAHYFDNCDPYFDRQIYQNDKHIVYGRYLETIIHSLENCDGFDVVGHFDYICRYAPYPDKKMYYRDFPSLFDTIFSLCIEKGKALELNTRTSAIFLSENRNDFMFDIDILTRYRKMGGELITFGSDAHQLDSILTLFNETKTILKETGFKNLVYYKQRSPIFVPI